MKEEQDDLARSGNQPLPGIGSNPFDRESPPEPRFGGYDRDEESDFDEPERDTNFAAGFHEGPADEEEAFETLLPQELEDDDEALFEEQSDFLRAESGAGEPDFAGYPRRQEPRFGADGDGDEPAPDYDWEDDGFALSRREADVEEDAVSREWAEEDYVDEDEEEGGWPLGLIAVGGLALLLVIAGAWGVMQQRSATQEEITQLRAQLATAASPEEVAASRAAVQDLKAENTELSVALDAARLENAGLRDTVAELEAQLGPRQAPDDAPRAEAEADPAPPSAEPEQVAQPEPEPEAPAPAAAGAGDWFVNFGSYSQRDTARDWAGKLAPSAGRVIVAEGSRDGAVFYRVRVVGLADKGAAEAVAAELSSIYGLPKLWVGRR